jgi:hypothetical protein
MIERVLHVVRTMQKKLLLSAVCLLLTTEVSAHPASGIVVDRNGVVYFVYSRHGVMRVEPAGLITNIHADDKGGHWLTVDPRGVWSGANLREYEVVALDAGPANLIFATGGAPLVVGPEGTLYYGSNGDPQQSFPTGAKTVAKVSPRSQPSVFAPQLQEKLGDLKDGITGLAAGADGVIYVATWNGILKLSRSGDIVSIWHPVKSSDCDHDPADHKLENYDSPLLRGLGVDDDNNVFVAATSCHQVLRITPDGHVTSVLKAQRPWSPTGIAIYAKSIFVLEYTNANGPATEGWYPRVRKIDACGHISTLVSIEPDLKR